MEPEALDVGAGSMAIGSLFLCTPTGVPIASANTDVSGAGPDDRDCIRQLVQVIRYLSAKGHHSAPQRMQDGVC